MKKLLLALVVIGAAFFGLLYFGEDHQRYLAFDKEREAWHRQCDVYRNATVNSPAVQECADELKRLMAYGKRQGW